MNIAKLWTTEDDHGVRAHLNRGSKGLSLGVKDGACWPILKMDRQKMKELRDALDAELITDEG